MRLTLMRMAVALFVLSVAVFDPAGLSPFGPAKWAAITTTLLLAASLSMGRPGSLPGEFRIAWSLFLVVMTLAAALGADDLYAWVGTPERHFGLLTWALCAVAFVVGIRSLPEIDSVAYSVVGLCAITGTYAIAEVAGWSPLHLAETSGRPGGVLGSSAYLGALVCLLVPICWGLVFDDHRPLPLRMVAALSAAVSFVALVASGARAAWVGAVVALILGALRLRKRRSTDRSWRPSPRHVASVAGGFLVIVALASATGVTGRATSAFTNDQGGLRGRLDEWRVGAHMILEHPLTGVGPEGYRIAFASVVDKAYDDRHGRDPLPDRAHSSILDVTATGGIFAGAAYLCLVALLIRHALRAPDGDSSLEAGIAIGIAAYLAQSLFLFPLAEIDPLMWLLAGLLVAAQHGQEELSDQGSLWPTWRLRSASTVLAIGAAGAFVLGSLDVAADRSARTTLKDLSLDREPHDPGRAARLRPDVVRYHLAEARGHEGSSRPGSYSDTVASLHAALRISPKDPVVRNEMARALLERALATRQSSDVDKALDALRSIQHDDPNNQLVTERIALAKALRTAIDQVNSNGT